MKLKFNIGGLLSKLGAVKGIFARFGKKKKPKAISDEDIDENDFIPSSHRDDEDEGGEGEDLGGGGDDDDEEIPDFSDDDDEDEDEEAVKKKRLLIMGGGGALAAAIVGAVVWVVVSPSGDEESAEEKSKIPTVVVNLETLEAETTARDQALGRDPGPGADPNAPGAAPGKSLNELGAGGAGGTEAPGTGVVVPATTPADYAGLSAVPPTAPLASSPDPKLVEQTELGILPKIAEDGSTAYQVYARPAPEKDGDKPRVAVIVVGLGNSRAATEAAIEKLPADISLTFDSYTRGIGYWVDKAREAGHEVLLTLPMESDSFPFEDPGPGTLKTLAAPEENLTQLNWVLSRTTGYFGLLGVAGSKFTANEEQVDFMVNALKDRGLMFVDSGDAPQSLVPRVAFKNKATWAAVEVNLDRNPSADAIDHQLGEFEALARRRIISIARISAYPVSLDRLSAWIKTLNEKGIELVPVSALANKQLLR